MIWNKIICPLCGTPLNPQISSDMTVDFDKEKADTRAWCVHDQRWIYYSANKKESEDRDNE